MIYRGLVVDIPNKKRIQKKTNYVYEIVERKGSVYSRDKVVCVGFNIGDNKMYPNDKYFDLHKEFNRPILSLDESKNFNSSLHIGGYLLLKTIADNEKIYDLLFERFDKYTNLILAYTYYVLLTQDSVAQHFQYYLFDNYLGLNYVPSETKLSHLFNEILSDDLINEFLTDWMNINLKNQNNFIDIDLDSTNFNVGSKYLNLAEMGKPKIDEKLPQINIAYFIDRNAGTPIYYDIYYGSIVDMAHCEIAINKVKTINPDAKFSFIMDRGYFSSKNLQYIEKNGYSYMCMGKHTTLLDNLIDDYPHEIISQSKNRVYSAIYGVKLKRKIFEDSQKQSFIYLYFNEGFGVNNVVRLQDELDKVSEQILFKNDKEGHIRNTYQKKINIEVDNDGIIIKAVPNYEFIDNYKRVLGYFYIVSNEDLSITDAIKAYRRRDIIEKTFLMSKSESDLIKKYCQTDTAYKAKTFIGFLTSIFRANIIYKLEPFFFEYKEKTSQTVLLEINKITTQQIGTRFILKYALTKEQKQILSFYRKNQNDAVKLIDELNTIFHSC